MRAAESTGQRGLYDSFNRVFAEVGEVNCWVRRRRRRAALSVCLSTSGAVPHPPFHLSLSLLTRSPSSFLSRQINPGEVKVLRGRSQSVLYSDGSGSDNPYEKKSWLRVSIEPTKLAVKVDNVEPTIPRSPQSSHGNGMAASVDDGSNGMGGFGTFARGAGGLNGSNGSSQGCSNSQDQSPTESPMTSWSRGTVQSPHPTRRRRYPRRTRASW